MTQGASKQPPDFLRKEGEAETGPAQPPVARVELLLDTHRVTGTLDSSGQARRLVDMIGQDGPVIILTDTTVESLIDPGEAPQSFQTLHMHREAILLAIPEWQAPPANDPIERVEKTPAPATLILPGLEITGHVYLPHGADPGNIRLIGRKEFMPVTHAEVTHVAAGLYRCQKALVAVNLARLVLYAPARL